MAIQYGTAQIHGLNGAVITCAGFLTPQPNIQSAPVEHSAVVEEINNQAGNWVGIIGNNETLSITIECIPTGTTLATAIASAYLPPIPTDVALTGFPNITIGSETDAINKTWYYLGGARINGASAEKWTMTLPLKRGPSITATTPII